MAANMAVGDLAEVLPLQAGMAAKLHLVKGSERKTEELRLSGEDRYRFPAHEEIWEVSCEPDRIEPRNPHLTDDRRRAS